ncbi:MAG: PorV/PorQ family protein [Candidatus Zixiibacteriota bacterium]
MMRKIIFIFIFTMTFISANVWSGDDGGTESVFSIGGGARAMGMGNGFIGLADDATAIYYNPAGLTSLQTQQVSFLHAVLFEETTYDFIAYAYPSTWGTFGFAGMRIGTDDIGRRGSDYYDLGRFSASQMQLLLSYSRSFHNRYSAGLTFKMNHQSIDNYSAYGFGFDLGGRAKIIENLYAGAVVQDVIGANMQLISEKERTPITYKTGLSYLVSKKNFPVTGRINLDLEKPENRSVKLRTGFEALHNSGLALRAGYDRDNPSLGMGIQYQNLFVDYAYKFVDHLSDSHRFSFTLNFGITQEQSNAQRETSEKENIQNALAENRKLALTKYLNQANDFYDAEMYDSAMAAYFRADAYSEDEDREFITSRIEEINITLGGLNGYPSRTDTIITGNTGVDLITQARILFEEGALIPARDMVRVARRYNIQSADLDTLDLAVNFAINRKINTNLEIANSSFDNGDYVTAYDKYNTVLMYDFQNELGRTGSQLAEKKLNLAQHLNLGLEYYNQGKYISSQRTLRMVLGLNPGNKTAQEYLDKIAERIHQSPSLEDLQKDTRIWNVYLEGLESFRRGEYENAIRLWENVLEVYPNNRNTIENIEQARLRLKK